MEFTVQRLVTILLFFVPVAAADIICGYTLCTGSGAYCCIKSDGYQGCCWDTYVYELWWFWLIWVAVFFMILACALACWSRRRARYRYTVMANSQYPTYGTVVHTSASSTTYSAPPGYNAQYATAPTVYPAAPVGPPSYETAEATKPPAYSN